MSRLFRNMDPLKVVILLLIAASIGLGVWNFMLGRQLDDARRAWGRAKSDVSKIHGLIKEITTLYRAMDEQGVGQDPGVYFENQLSEVPGGIPKVYTLKTNEKRVVAGRGKTATEHTITVDFGGQGKRSREFLPRKNWFTALYNCEQKSKSWRLRELKARCKDDMDSTRKRDSGYEDEIQDEWYVEKLVFAMREPLSK